MPRLKIVTNDYRVPQLSALQEVSDTGGDAKVDRKRVDARQIRPPRKVSSRLGDCGTMQLTRYGVVKAASALARPRAFVNAFPHQVTRVE
jgi:hypothetical protein